MARVCQKCGHTGFQQVMIYCRQCRIACEHKYCLYKFPKMGEKIRWYCEECKPTIFAASSPNTLEVDTGRGKSYPESIQELQNQEPCSNQKLQNQSPNSNLKTNSPDALCTPQLETVQKEAESMKTSSDLLCANEKSSKRRKLTISNDSHSDQKASDTPSNHFPKLVISNDSHLDQKVPDTPSNHFPPPVTSCGDTTMHEVFPETSTHKNTNNEEIEVHRPDTSIQNIPITARPFIDYVWRGCISFGNGEFIPFRAHLSCLACQRVSDAVKLLPPILPMDKFFRRDLEQNIFKNGPPTGDGIGLYFFPDIYAKPEHVFRLIDDSIRKDLMFVFTFDELELFISLSCILPEEHHKFNEQYYLWGGFRKKQLPVTTTSTNHHSEPNNEPTENIRDKEVNIKVKAEDKAEAQATLFGSPITEKLKRVIQGINQKHSQSNNTNPPNRPTANKRTIEEIRAEYKQTRTYDNSFRTHRRRLWNPQDREKFHAGPRRNMHTQQAQKRLPQNTFASRFTDDRSGNEGLAYNKLASRLTPRQRSLYELKKEQNRDGTRQNERTENRRGLFESAENFLTSPGGTRISSRVKRKTETNGEDWIAYFEQDDMQAKVKGPRSKRNRTRNDSSGTANAIEEGGMNNRGDGDECNEKQNCMEETVKKDERIAGERSASPVSSTCTEEQKPRGILEKFTDLERLEEGEISS